MGFGTGLGLVIVMYCATKGRDGVELCFDSWLHGFVRNAICRVV